jgi:hypothetical protein
MLFPLGRFAEIALIASPLLLSAILQDFLSSPFPQAKKFLRK